MKWKIDIENHLNYRIYIQYLPIENKIKFIGEYKMKNQPWTVLYETNHMEYSGLTMEDLVYDVFNETRNKVNTIEMFNEYFKTLHTVEINDEDD